MMWIGVLTKYLKQKFLLWVLDQKWYKWFVLNVIWRLRLSTTNPRPSNKNFQKWGSLSKRGYPYLKPGDIILTVDTKKISTAIISKVTAENVGETDFIPSHAALCVSKGGEFEFAEMTHMHYTKSMWEDICFESTRVVIMRCGAFDDYYIHKVLIPECLKLDGSKYDVKFDMGGNDLACSELIYKADKEKRLVVDLEPLLGVKPYLSPMGLYKSLNCYVVWDSDKETLDGKVQLAEIQTL